jgi:biopolymer transport protein ExbB
MVLASIVQFLADIAVTQTADVAAQAAPVADELTFWNMAVKGGWIMIFLALFSIVAVYIIVERAFAITKAAKEDMNFMNEVKTFVAQGKIEEAHIRCQGTDSPVARMIDKGISRIGKPLADVREAIENVGKLEVANLEKGLPMLATISSVGPMIGFLGTVLGMITAFYDMANAGGNFSIAMLSNGIYTAMVTTVAGLIVGVIAMLGYNILVAEIGKVVNKLELRTTEFMDLLNEPVA